MKTRTYRERMPDVVSFSLHASFCRAHSVLLTLQAQSTPDAHIDISTVMLPSCRDGQWKATRNLFTVALANELTFQNPQLTNI